MKYSFLKNKFFFLAIFIALSQIITAQSANCFTLVGTYAAATNPEAMTTADFNHDGNTDVAVTNNTSNNVSVLLGIGTGSFLAAVNYTVGGGPCSVASDDFNADGHIDLAVANYNSNNVTILLGSNSGTFSTYGFYPVGARPISIITTDVNKDGKPDLATSNITANNVSVMLGVGNGGFYAATNYTAGTSPIALSAADFNNDTQLDLAVVNLGTNDVTLLFGSNSGTFTTGNSFGVGSSPISITAYDFNNDGHSDVAVGNNGSNDLSVLMGNGAGSFTTTFTYPLGGSPYSVISKELNGDGVIDLATANYVGQNISVLLGSPTGTFAAAVNISNATVPYSLISADFNNDNRADIAVADIFTNKVGVYLNDPPLFLNSSANEVCVGQSVTLNASGANTYSWSTGASGTSIVVSPTVLTTYTVTGTSTLTGCYNHSVKTISVNPIPVLSVNSGSICEGTSFTMTPSGANSYTYSSNNVVVTPSISSTYTVYGSSIKGCVDSVECFVHVYATPTLTVNSGSICVGESFTMNPVGANTYTYSNGSAITSPTTSSSYSVSGTDINGCVSSVDAVAQVTVNLLPVINISTTNTLLCAGETATLLAAGATSYTWSNSLTSAAIIVSPTVTMNYTVNGTDVNGCVNTSTISQGVSACAGVLALANSKDVVNVYPNPNNGCFFVEINTASHVVLTNIFGQVVLSETIEAGVHCLNIQTQSSGIYLLNVVQATQNYTLRLIKD